MITTNLEQRKKVLNDAFNRYFKIGEQRDLITSTGAGFAVPTEVFPVLQEISKHYFPVLERVTVRESSNGRPAQIAVEDGTAVFLSPQNEDATPATAESSYSKSILDHDLVSGAATASIQLLNDSAWDIGSLITNTGGKALSRTLDYAIHAGTDVAGNGLPNNAGLISTAVVGTTTASVAAGIGEGDLATLVESTDSNYWPDSIFVMNGSTYLNLLQQKDSTGRRFWKELGDAPQPHLWQWPVYISNAVPSIAANNVPVLFGAYRYVVLSTTGLSVQKLSERYMDSLRFGYMLTSRIASKLTAPNSIKALRIAAS